MTASEDRPPAAARPIPTGGVATGSVRVPPSKSVTHRCLNLALVARAPIALERPLYAEDTLAFLAALEALGWRVERLPEEVRVEPGPGSPEARLDCGNAGTLCRFLIGSLATLPGRFTVDGTARLRQRPVGALVEALRRLGASLDFLGEPGFVPVAVAGGSLRGGRAVLDASESSQYLSALLMASLAAREAVEIEVSALTSEPYVALTLAATAAFGGAIEEPRPGLFRVRPGLSAPPRLAIEADYSAACYPAAAAALTGGRVVLEGLASGSAQGDRAFLDLLARMGARVEPAPGGVEVRGTGALAAVEADLAATPDQVPTLAALAPFAEGVTRITGVPHLRIKESDRLAAMAEELARAGAEVVEHADGLTIPGVWAKRSPPSAPVVLGSHGDHRIAMSLALVGLRRPGLSIADPGVVAKSYPSFWRDLAALLSFTERTNTSTMF